MAVRRSAGVADEIGADAYTEDAASAAECAKKYAESGFCAKAAAGEFDQVSVKGEESVTAGAEDKEKNIAMTDAQTKVRAGCRRNSGR